MDNDDIIEDAIILCEKTLEASRNQKRYLELYMEEMAEIMDQLKTDMIKQELVEITQENYKKMIELETNIALGEEQLRKFKESLE